MRHILVIDDDPHIRRVMGYALRDEGYAVEEAPDGAMALAAIGHRHPDLILVDMKMPGMDGWAFIEAYRARYDRRAPIVVVTAARDAAQRGREVEADGYLSKPFDLEALIECVAALAPMAEL